MHLRLICKATVKDCRILLRSPPKTLEPEANGGPESSAVAASYPRFDAVPPSSHLDPRTCAGGVECHASPPATAPPRASLSLFYSQLRPGQIDKSPRCPQLDRISTGPRPRKGTDTIPPTATPVAFTAWLAAASQGSTPYGSHRCGRNRAPVDPAGRPHTRRTRRAPPCRRSPDRYSRAPAPGLRESLP
jgi:hypothetical protein